MKTSNRASGVLLHVTSLPAPFGIGDLGSLSYRFVDLLYQSGQRYWNILPLTPTSTEYGNSPYQPTSAFAGNTLLISPEMLAKDGLISEEYVEKFRVPFGCVDFRVATQNKELMLEKAYQNFKKTMLKDGDFEEFCTRNSDWLDDYALFRALRIKIKRPWNRWPTQIRDQDKKSLADKRDRLNELIGLEKFAQFVFFRQLGCLKHHCMLRKVKVIGDLPFYMSHDSADAWAHPELFKLDRKKNLKFVGGVPPDYFSKKGQYWGNPIYDWRNMRNTDFRWWIDRISQNLKFCDILRLDHFRGFTAYWQIPASFKTARKGKWIRGPAKKLFEKIESVFPSLPFIAEDLGFITKNVRGNLKRTGIPGMRVLLFAFDGSPDNPNLPVNYSEDTVVFTGTHDTNTVRGWFKEEAGLKQLECLFSFIGRGVSENQISFEFMRLALASTAKLCIIPFQDVLSLSSEARMNLPSKERQNWKWRFEPSYLTTKAFSRLKEATEISCR